MATLISPPFPISKVTERLWLGTIYHAKALLLENPGIGLVLNCTDETIPRPAGVHVQQLGLRAGREIPQQKLVYAASVIHQYLLQSAEEKRTVLVCCHDAKSLSPTVLLSYLAAHRFGGKESTPDWRYLQALEALSLDPAYAFQ